MEGEMMRKRAPPSLILKGKRVTLSSPSPEDDPAMRVILSHPNNLRHLSPLHRSPEWTLQEVAARREAQMADQQQDKSLVLYVHIEDPDGHNQYLSGSVKGMIVAGTTGFRYVHFENDSAELGIIIHHVFWKLGLATEAMYLCLAYAFESLQLQRVDWFTDRDNASMRGWLEGFLGLKAFAVSGEGMETAVGYSLSRLDWENRAKSLLEGKIGARESRET